MSIWDRLFNKGGDQESSDQPQSVEEILRRLRSGNRGGAHMFVGGPDGFRPVNGPDDLASIFMGGDARGRSYENSPFSGIFGSGDMEINPFLASLLGLDTDDSSGEDEDTMKLLTSTEEPEIDIDDVVTREAGQRVLLEEKLAAAMERNRELQSIGRQLVSDKRRMRVQAANESRSHVQAKQELFSQIKDLGDQVSEARNAYRNYRGISVYTDIALDSLIGELTNGATFTTEELVERLEIARDIYYDRSNQYEYETRKQTMGQHAEEPPKPRAQVRAAERERAAQASATEPDPPEQPVNTAETVVSAAGASSS